MVREGRGQRGLNTKRHTFLYFLGSFPRNLSNQALTATGDTILVKSREMTGRTQMLPWWWGRMGKDDRKQNTLAPLEGAYI
jgi:hypothetical protein